MCLTLSSSSLALDHSATDDSRRELAEVSIAYFISAFSSFVFVYCRALPRAESGGGGGGRIQTSGRRDHALWPAS